MPNAYLFISLFFFTDPATTEIYTLSLHDALPIYAMLGSHERDDLPVCANPRVDLSLREGREVRGSARCLPGRSEEHTSELQSRLHLVCRLLLEKNKSYSTCKYECFIRALFATDHH